MSKIFPKDCEMDCKYYSQHDMSVDDYVGICKLLKLQCDLCDGDSSTIRCPLEDQEVMKIELEKLKLFKEYFDELYGKGLDIANWHNNGNLEPFDNFYESATEYSKQQVKTIIKAEGK